MLMKTKNLMTTIFLLFLVITSSIYLSTFSGCRIYVPLAEYPDPCNLCLNDDGFQLAIYGPNVLESCTSQESYTFIIDDYYADTYSLKSMAEWVVSDGIEIVGSKEANSVTIQGTKPGIWTTLTLSVKDLEDCPNSGKTLATKKIYVSSRKADINSTVCKDPSNLGVGVLTVIDPETNSPITGVDNIIWSVSSGSAVLDPQPDIVTCHVQDAIVDANTGVLTITVQLGQKDCISNIQSFDITIPKCQQ